MRQRPRHDARRVWRTGPLLMCALGLSALSCSPRLPVEIVHRPGRPAIIVVHPGSKKPALVNGLEYRSDFEPVPGCSAAGPPTALRAFVVGESPPGLDLSDCPLASMSNVRLYIRAVGGWAVIGVGDLASLGGSE